MNAEIKNKFDDKTKVLPGLAAALLYSEYGKKNIDNLNFTSDRSSSLSTETNSKKSIRPQKSNWKWSANN